MAEKNFSWRNAVVYYPYVPTYYEHPEREQQGIGTIRGIQEKLDYITEDVGANVIWLSPFCEGPMEDGGYDTTNQKEVNPKHGTLEDIKNLIADCHERGVKVLFDYIANHTHVDHPWFKASRNREPGYENFYHWHPGIVDENGERHPPNNWPSRFSEPNKAKRLRGEFPELGPDDPTPAVPMWQWDDVRGEYYMRTFIQNQADLNWNNPEVVKKQLDVMKFWLDLGIDGFRIDAVNHMAKDPALTDEVPNPDYDEVTSLNPMEQWTEDHYCNYWPLLKKYILQMCDVVEENTESDPFVLLETYASPERLHKMTSLRPEISATFNFTVMASEWDAMTRKRLIEEYLHALPEKATPNYVNGNMDNSRSATVLGDAQARAAGLMNIMLPGMTIVHNGEELGLHDGRVPEDRMKDPNGFRDDFRTPMIWDDTLPNAGFSAAPKDELYLPINEDDVELAANKQREDSKSTLNMYKAAIRLMRSHDALSEGEYVSLDSGNEHVYAFGRKTGESEALVLTNFSDETQVARLGTVASRAYDLVLSSIDVEQSVRTGVHPVKGVELGPNEAVVLIAK